MENIKNIIFDLGGVILNIDYLLTEKAFQRLGIIDFAAHYSQMKQNNLFDKLETGQISEKSFIEEIQSFLSTPISGEEIINAWNAMLLDLPLRRLQILQQLQLHYNTFLLSNTNSIHEKKFNERLHSLTGMPTFAIFFDKIYYSHRVGLRKPNREIFEFILNENKLQASETLFIDDSPQHIEAAKTLGLQTIYLTNGKTIEDDVFKSLHSVDQIGS